VTADGVIPVDVAGLDKGFLVLTNQNLIIGHLTSLVKRPEVWDVFGVNSLEATTGDPRGVALKIKQLGPIDLVVVMPKTDLDGLRCAVSGLPQITEASVTRAQQASALETRSGRAAGAAAPGREVGEDPASGKTVTVRSGRFGPYVTDGEVNASLRTGEDPDAITIERAADLLAARRQRLASGESERRPRQATL
jgi:hypothetical protein